MTGSPLKRKRNKKLSHLVPLKGQVCPQGTEFLEHVYNVD